MQTSTFELLLKTQSISEAYDTLLTLTTPTVEGHTQDGPFPLGHGADSTHPTPRTIEPICLYAHTELQDFPTNKTIYFAPTALQAVTPHVDPQFIASLRCERHSNDIETVPIIMDTGCSFAVTFDPSDFIGPPIYNKWGSIMTANGTADITALGTAQWTVMLSDGSTFDLQVPCHLVPECTHRLMSPQDYLRYHGLSNDSDQFGGTAAEMWINLQDAPAPLRCAMDPSSQLPVFMALPPKSPKDTTPNCKCHLTAGSYNVMRPDNENLTRAQKGLLLDHQRLGHTGMDHIQRLYTPYDVDFDDLGSSKHGKPCLQPPTPKSSSCPIPMCVACQHAKAHRRAHGAKTNQDTPDRRHIINLDKLVPGQLVSVDHYESPVRGRLPNTRGREREHRQYVGGTLFYDHATKHISVQHQPTLSATDTIRSKLTYEQTCRRYGVEIQAYHTDNGHFASQEFLEELQSERQTIQVSGVGAHHQNPYAERAIQTTVYRARAMMIHAQIMWPNEFDIKLWPFALSYAAWLYNHIPDKYSGLAPEELLSGARLNCSYLRRARVWGCPAFVLDPKLHDAGKKIPKWKPRAQMGQFMGISPMHSSSVKLIRNIETNYVTPQFHVVFDELFTTVDSERRIDVHETMTDLFRTAREHVFDEDEGHAEADLLPIYDPELLPGNEYYDIPRRQENQPNAPRPPAVQQGEPRVVEQGEPHAVEQGEPRLDEQGEPPANEQGEPRAAEQGELPIAEPNERRFGEQGEPPVANRREPAGVTIDEDPYIIPYLDMSDPEEEIQFGDSDSSDDDSDSNPDNDTNSLIEDEEEPPVPIRTRRQNPRFFGPDWTQVASRSYLSLRRNLSMELRILLLIDWSKRPADPTADQYWQMLHRCTDVNTGEV